MDKDKKTAISCGKCEECGSELCCNCGKCCNCGTCKCEECHPKEVDNKLETEEPINYT